MITYYLYKDSYKISYLRKVLMWKKLDGIKLIKVDNQKLAMVSKHLMKLNKQRINRAFYQNKNRQSDAL